MLLIVCASFATTWAPLQIKGLILPLLLIWAPPLKLAGLWLGEKTEKSNSKKFPNAKETRQSNIKGERVDRPEFTGALNICFCFKHDNVEINGLLV